MSEHASQEFDGAEDTLLMVPTLNEVANIAPLASRLDAAGFLGDVLFIDDASSDGTPDAITRAISRHPNWHLLQRIGTPGLGRAYQDAIHWGLARDYSHYAAMDADLSHDPGDLVRLLSHRSESALVLGSRYIQGNRHVVGWPVHRLRLSLFANAYCRAILGYKLADWTSGFKVIERTCLQRVARRPFNSDGYAFQIELHHRVLADQARHEGILEVPITFSERLSGESKLSWAAIIEASVAVWKLRLESNRSR